MSAAVARQMHWTEAEYLAMENQSSVKHEYFQGEIFAMAGARAGHHVVMSALGGELYALVKAGNCTSFSGEQRIHVRANGLYSYPDGGVVCGSFQMHSDGMALLNPVLLFEVLSPATRDYDLGAKRQLYREIPSLRHLILIDQPEHMAWHDFRDANGEWQTREIGAEGEIQLPDLGGSIALAGLYPTAASGLL